MAIGKRIKLALREEGMSIKELAEKVGVSVNTLYSVTRRDSERMDSITLDRIAEVLNLPVPFFTSDHPFYDLATLEITKKSNLEMMKEAGYDIGAYKEISDIPDIQYWRLIGKHIKTSGLDNSPVHKSDLEELNELFPPSGIYNDCCSADQLLQAYYKLNPTGQQIAVERVEELTEIKRYQKEN